MAERQIRTTKIHIYCFDCKNDLKTEVQSDKADQCPSCESTWIAHAPRK